MGKVYEEKKKGSNVDLDPALMREIDIIKNLNYLKLIAEYDDRTPSYILNKMIDAFRDRGCFAVEQIK